MLASQAQGFLAKEAECLEQAKQANDEDLAHLHETIAKQWRLLAEGIETGPAGDRARAPTTDATSETNTNAAPGTLSARRVETPLEWILSCWLGGNLGGK